MVSCSTATNTTAVSYEYFTPSANESEVYGLWHVVTDNKVTFDADDASMIKAVLQVDELGRTMRMARLEEVGNLWLRLSSEKISAYSSARKWNHLLDISS